MTWKFLHTPAINDLRRMAIEGVLDIPKIEGLDLKRSSVGSEYYLSITRLNNKLYAAVTEAERASWISGEVPLVANPKKYEQQLPVKDHGNLLGSCLCGDYFFDVYELQGLDALRG